MTAIVVLCPKMKAPTTMVMIPQTVKTTLQNVTNVLVKVSTTYSCSVPTYTEQNFKT